MPNMENNFLHIEVRDSRTGYAILVHNGMGVWPDGKIVGEPSESSGNSDPKYVNFEFCNKIWKLRTVPFDPSRQVSIEEFDAGQSL